MREVHLVDLGRFESCIEEAIGPGRRAGIWVRGCPFRCPGCCTPEFLRSGAVEERVAVSDIIARLREAVAEHQIEGVTFSGGEPFAQAVALKEIAGVCRLSGLSTIAWSGYTLEELCGSSAPEGASAFLECLDVLIDGRYDQNLPVAPMRGSSNQRLHLLSSRYSRMCFENRALEFRFDATTGGLISFGIVSPLVIETAMAMLGLETLSSAKI